MMNKYKSILLEGFKQRGLEIHEVTDNDEWLPWWIEEKWVLNGWSAKLGHEQLIITFLTDRSWESGSKQVADIIVTSKEMNAYLDDEFELVRLDMRKGSFG